MKRAYRIAATAGAIEAGTSLVLYPEKGFETVTFNESLFDETLHWTGYGEERPAQPLISELAHIHAGVPGAIIGRTYASIDGALVGEMRGFLLRGKTAIQLEPPASGTETYAAAINTGMMIAGTVEIDATKHACVWRDSRCELLGVECITPYGVNAINDDGIIVGETTASAKEGMYRAFLWREGVVRYLPGFGGAADARDVNNHGVTVGRSHTDLELRGPIHAVCWGDSVTILPPLRKGDNVCEANGINDRGQIVGGSWGRDPNNARACLWEDGSLIDLNRCLSGFGPDRPRPRLTIARAINEAGQIYCEGHYGFSVDDYTSRHFILEPAS